MKINEETEQTLTRCIQAPIPFALWHAPGAAEPELIVDELYGEPAPASARHFVVAPWSSEELPPICQRKASTTPSFPSISATPNQSTDKDRYIASLTSLIDELRRSGGKTVISRISVVTFRANASRIIETFQALSNSNPLAFSFLYYTPGTGFWIGATPELLLRTSGGGRKAFSMALAGSRHTGSEGKWDDKNTAEQAFVRNFVAAAFEQCCSDTTVEPTETLRAGNVEHICNRISGTLAPGKDADDLLHMLNPTPAVCGFPKERALGHIASIEEHNRLCYSGYVGVRSGADMELYVNLRCATFDAERVCIFSGGGITADSDPECEWAETAMKATPMLNLFNPRP